MFAHIDVVPASQGMFHLEVEGDKAFGRGVSDMKGNILPFLMAYADACSEGKPPPVSILITSDEETAGSTIPYLLKEGVLANEPAAFTPDTNHKGMVVEHKGGVWLELICKGKGGHGAYPWDAENPHWVLDEALQNIKHAFPDGSEADWQMTVSPNITSAGKAGNQIPDEVRCTLDVRYPPEVCSSAEEVAAKVCDVLPDNAQLSILQAVDHLCTDPSSTVVQLYKQIADEVLKQDTPFKREHGGTDARYFGAYGIPAFLYGPEGGGIHSKDEWVSLISLAKHYDIYRKLFLTL